MKKIFYVFAALAVMAAACTKPEPITPSITLTSQAEVGVPVDGSTETVTFEANVPWTASLDNSNWTISPSSGEAGTVSVKVSSTPNATNDPVYATLTIKAQTATQTVKFIQVQKDGMVISTTEYEAPAEASTVTVKVMANVAVKATTSTAWITIPEPTKGLVEKDFALAIAANEGEAREGTVVFEGAGTPVEVTIKQAAWEPYFEIEGYELDEEGNAYVEVPSEGGEYALSVNTNLSYEFEPYIDAFPTQHAVRNGDDYEVTIDKNDTFNEVKTYIKFTLTIPGSDDAVKVKVYFVQAAKPCFAYTNSMYDMEFDTWGTTVLSEAVFNGKHYVCNGQDVYEIDPATGAYQKITVPFGSGMTQKVITTDDAGNLIVCNHTAYDAGADAYLDGYFILNVVTPAGEESNLITKAAYECGGPFGAKLKVRGDITSNAIITAPVEGIAGSGMSKTLGYWEVTEGVLSDYNKLDVEGIVATWGMGYWNAYPENFPTIIAIGTKAADGFIMSGAYEENASYFIAADGTATKKMNPEFYLGEDEVNGNFGFHSMDIRNIGGTDYLVIVASPFFPSYGADWCGSAYVALHKLSSIQEGTSTISDAAFCKTATYYFDPESDWAINVFADVALYDANGKIGIAFADLNSRCIEAYEVEIDE